MLIEDNKCKDKRFTRIRLYHILLFIMFKTEVQDDEIWIYAM